MERNERLKAADKCASIYTDENEVRIARKAFMLGCEFEAQGEIIKGVILDTKDGQPSEDLETEMEKYFDGWVDDPEYGQAVLPHTYECVGVSDCKDIARHFYILGLKNNIPVTQITLDELAEKDWGILQDMSIGEEEED